MNVLDVNLDVIKQIARVRTYKQLICLNRSAPYKLFDCLHMQTQTNIRTAIAAQKDAQTAAVSAYQEFDTTAKKMAEVSCLNTPPS